MKTGIYLLLLSEICFEFIKAGIKPKILKEEKENNFLERNNNVNISKEWYHHKNISKPFEDQGFEDQGFEDQGLEDFTLYNFTEKTANFGFNLYRKIAMTHDNNVIISPLSVSALMTVYMLAAKGETYRQIVKGLNLHAVKDKVDRQHLPALFKQLISNITMNEEFLLVQVDFENFTQAKLLINQNINKRTKGKIPDLFEELDRHNKLVLVDYIVFKGKWVNPFNSKFTEMETFHINKYRSVQVPMMFKSDKINSTFDENLRCTVIKIPYKGNAHMLIVIPEKEGDYISIEDHLTTELVESWLGNMKTRKVDISFPKFKLEQKYKMKKLLHGLGIKKLFTRSADLSHLTDQEYAAVSQVVQKAVIEVDEEGTEAAAASGSEITAFTVPPVIKVDRPFLFMIFEETFKTLLFIGRVVDPTE
ncbi:ZPI inhibitor, partial [Ptilonorhynchus violaceus]|nr:ZPI inhibitor [Ptilonorhynchus violaceus]